MASEKTTVALLDLEAKGVDENEASTLTDRIRTELFKTNQFIVMERSAMDKILAEQGFQMSGTVDEESIVKAGEMLGVELIIIGSVSRIGRLYNISLRSIDVQSGAIAAVASVDNEGSIEEVARESCPEVVDRLVGVGYGVDKKYAKKGGKKWLYIGGAVIVAGVAAYTVLAGEEEVAGASNQSTIVIEIPANP